MVLVLLAHLVRLGDWGFERGGEGGERREGLVVMETRAWEYRREETLWELKKG